MIDQNRLLSAAEYKCLTPRGQGFATYMQAMLPGSKIPKNNPYSAGSKEWQDWKDGAHKAVMDVQDDDS